MISGLQNLLKGLAFKHTRKTESVMEPVFIPLDLNSLNVTLGSIIDKSKAVVVTGGAPSRTSLKLFRTKIITFITTNYKNKIILVGNEIIVNGKKGLPLDIILGKHTPAIVYVGGGSTSNIAGIIFNKFNAAQASFFDSFLNVEMTQFLRDTLDADFEKFDAAFVFKNRNDPLVKKVSMLSKILNSFSKNNVKIEGVPLEANKASVIQIRTTVDALLRTYSRTQVSGIDAHASISESITNFTNNIRADIVIIQDASDTRALEAELFSNKNVDRITKVLVGTTEDKTSFLAKIGNKIISIFTGKPTRISASIKKTVPINTGRASSVKVNTTAGKTGTYNFPEPRVSISQLQGLLNNSLEAAIKANMGTGMSTSVLNYQIGRFAKNAKVEAISLGRTGALTAFYSYMRYPYGTFAEGGKQQNPRTRDPTLLIGKSIRQIAIEKANIELRTVVI